MFSLTKPVCKYIICIKKSLIYHYLCNRKKIKVFFLLMRDSVHDMWCDLQMDREFHSCCPSRATGSIGMADQHHPLPRRQRESSPYLVLRWVGFWRAMIDIRGNKLTVEHIRNMKHLAREAPKLMVSSFWYSIYQILPNISVQAFHVFP